MIENYYKPLLSETPLRTLKTVFIKKYLRSLRSKKKGLLLKEDNPNFY
jgi:hypothetical protein